MFLELSQKERLRRAYIQDPKYFEQNVSDYSDVVPLLQKVHQNTDRTHRFFVGYTFWSAKRKRLRQNYKRSAGRAEFT